MSGAVFDRFVSQDFKDGMSVLVFEGKIEESGSGIEQDDVGPVSQKALSFFDKGVSLFPEDGDRPCFRSDEQTTSKGIEGQDVRPSSYGKPPGDFAGFKVEDEEYGVLFAGDESQTSGAIDPQPVGMCSSGQRIPANETRGSRIDFGQEVLGLDG